MTPSDSLTDRLREIGSLQSLLSLLEWDQETYMPRDGVAGRADQVGAVAGLAHELLTHDDTRRALDNAAPRPDDFVAQTNLREARRAFDRAVRIPTELVKEIAHVSTHAKAAWAAARERDRFVDFAPHLEKLVSLKKRVADCVGYTTEPYDALMDEFEPGARAADIARVFAELKEATVAFLRRVMSSSRKPDRSILHGRYPAATQAELCHDVARSLGFNFDAGRLDVSVHPFCNSVGGCGDVRITTRYHEDDFASAIFSVLHEVGHALYEQGLPAEHRFTPMGQAASTAIHESQSRTWENFVGRSKAFWSYHWPKAQAMFPEPLRRVSLDAFHGVINAAEPSLIRVEADELTYNLHIILRFELERAMFQGSIAVADLPSAWNEQMKSLLGITPPTNREGCLQDIHWSIAIFGYFPTYTLGNLYAAQFFEKAQQDIPELWSRVAANDHAPLLNWLRTNIHQHGQRFRPGELVERVTGAPLSIEPFRRYITAKLGEVYSW